MALNATLTLTVGLLDDENRNCGPGAPLRQSWSPLDYSSKRVSLAAEADTVLDLFTGATCLLLELGTAKNLLLKSSAGDDGIPLAGTVLPLGLPAVIPLGDAPVVRIFNAEETVQYVRVWVF